MPTKQSLIHAKTHDKTKRRNSGILYTNCAKFSHSKKQKLRSHPRIPYLGSNAKAPRENGTMGTKIQRLYITFQAEQAHRVTLGKVTADEIFKLLLVLSLFVAVLQANYTDWGM
jgi:hypothetical protein